jgi:hypothetical protein
MDHPSDPHATLYVTDAELIRRMGVPEKIARRVIRDLDAKHHTTGFPQKQELWGDRRYWPAVKSWLDRTSAHTMGLSQGRKRHAR